MFPKFVFFPLAEELFVQHTTSSSENKTKQKQNKTTMSSKTVKCTPLFLPLWLQSVISERDSYWEDVLYKAIAWELF